jgi:hypothetical protein
MTKKELRQLYCLNREIEEEQRRLRELEAKKTKLPDCATEIDSLKGLMNSNLKRCFMELNKLNRYINSIDDSFIRMIFALRYINGLSWNQVAASIGGNTEDSVRKAHDRFLKKGAIA